LYAINAVYLPELFEVGYNLLIHFFIMLWYAIELEYIKLLVIISSYYKQILFKINYNNSNLKDNKNVIQE
jgi:hypothetical protein